MSQSLLTIQTANDPLTLTVDRFLFLSALSTPDELQISLTADTAETRILKDLPANTSATLTFTSATNARDQTLSGVITATALDYDQVHHHTQVKLTLRPQIIQLADSRHVQLLVGQSVAQCLQQWQQVASQMLGPFPYQQTLVGLDQPLVGIEIQYADSDLGYLRHLCQYGALYYFVQGPEHEQLVVTNQIASLPKHPEPLTIDRVHRPQVHLDQPVFYGEAQHWASVPAHAQPRHYDPQQSADSVQQLTAETESAVVERPELYALAKDSATRQRLEQALTSDQNRILLSGHYSRLRVGERVTVEGTEYVVEAQILSGYYRHQRWGFDTQVTLVPAIQLHAMMAPGMQLFVEPERLPSHLYANQLKAAAQVNQDGGFRVQLSQAFTQQQLHNPDVLVRDVQGTSTQSGGHSHSTSFDGEVVLSRSDRVSDGWVMAGSLSNAKTPSTVSIDSEHDTQLSNQGGLSLRLRRQRENQPHAHLQVGVTDINQNESYLRLGAHHEEGQESRYGRQEKSTGFAKKVVNKHALVQVAQDIDHPTYRFQHQANDGLHEIQEDAVVDSYSERYYQQPLASQPLAAPAAFIVELAFAELTQTVSTNSAETSVSSQQITWTLQPASATVQKGQLSFAGNSLPSVSILSGQRSLQVAGLQPGQVYTATLTLVLDNQQTIEQVLSLTKLQGIQRWQIHYQTNSHGDLHAQLAWSLPDELTAQVVSYQVRSASLGNNQPFTIANSKRGVALKQLDPNTLITVQWTANLNNGTTLTNALVFKTPKPTQQEAKANPNKLGYEHTMSEGSVRKEWNIDQVETVLPLLQPMATHAANPATFIPTSHISPTQLMPNTSQSYIQQFNRNQVTQPLPYSEAEAQGPGAAMSTATVMKLNQSGDSTHYHAGQTIVNTTVNEFIHQAESPLILNQHQGTRTQIQEGQLYARTHLDHHRNSHREVAVHGTLKQNLANSQVTIDHANQTVQNTKVTAQTFQARTQTKTVKRSMTSIQAGSVNIGGGYHGAVQKAQLQVEKMFPSFTYEFEDFPEALIYERDFNGVLVTITAKPKGSITLSSEKSINPLELTNSGLQIDAQKALQTIMQGFTVPNHTGLFFMIDNKGLHLQAKAHFIKVTDNFGQIPLPNQYQAEIDNVEANTKYHSWVVHGLLSFIFTLTLTPTNKGSSSIFNAFDTWLTTDIVDPIVSFGTEVGSFVHAHKTLVIRATFWLLKEVQHNIQEKGFTVKYSPNAPKMPVELPEVLDF